MLGRHGHARCHGGVRGRCGRVATVLRHRRFGLRPRRLRRPCLLRLSLLGPLLGDRLVRRRLGRHRHRHAGHGFVLRRRGRCQRSERERAHRHSENPFHFETPLSRGAALMTVPRHSVTRRDDPANGRALRPDHARPSPCRHSSTFSSSLRASAGPWEPFGGGRPPQARVVPQQARR